MLLPAFCMEGQHELAPVDDGLTEAIVVTLFVEELSVQIGTDLHRKAQELFRDIVEDLGRHLSLNAYHCQAPERNSRPLLTASGT